MSKKVGFPLECRVAESSQGMPPQTKILIGFILFASAMAIRLFDTFVPEEELPSVPVETVFDRKAKEEGRLAVEGGEQIRPS